MVSPTQDSKSAMFSVQSRAGVSCARTGPVSRVHTHTLRVHLYSDRDGAYNRGRRDSGYISLLSRYGTTIYCPTIMTVTVGTVQTNLEADSSVHGLEFDVQHSWKFKFKSNTSSKLCRSYKGGWKKERQLLKVIMKDFFQIMQNITQKQGVGPWG